MKMRYSLYIERQTSVWTLSVERNSLPNIEAARAKYAVPGCRWAIINNETGEIAKGGWPL